MYEFKVISPKEPQLWNDLVRNCSKADTYFLEQYCSIYEESYGEEIDEMFQGIPLLFFYGNHDEYIIEPFIKRNINVLAFLRGKKEFQQVFDLTSPYGYCGPIISVNGGMVGQDLNISETLVKGYLQKTEEFCKKENILCAFIRFHPLLKNQVHFSQFSEKISCKAMNKTVSIDLTKDIDAIFLSMNKKTRNLIRKAQKNGVLIEESSNAQDYEMLTKYYLETMERNKVRGYYYFPLKYFTTTASKLKGNISLYKATYNGVVIATSLFMHYEDIVQYHFSGLNADFRHLAANNLLIFEVIKKFKAQGCKTLHLGGGNSSDPDDSLFRFKHGFSDKTHDYHIGKRIFNPKIYKELSGLKEKYGALVKITGKINQKSDFFPYYRS